jgi:hypothetical protein
MLTGPLLAPLVGTVSTLASNAARNAGEVAKRTAKDVALLTIGAFILIGGLGFLTAAAFMGLAQEVGSAWAAAIVGVVLMLTSLPLFLLATRQRPRPAPRVVATVAATPPNADQPWGSIAAAFAAGIGAAALLKRK